MAVDLIRKRAAQRAWYLANRERLLAYYSAYHQKNKVARNARAAERWRENRSRHNAQRARRAAEEPEVHAYARKTGVGIREARRILNEIEVARCEREARAGTVDWRRWSETSPSASRAARPGARG